MRAVSRIFLLTGVIALLCGLLFGCLAGVSFLFPTKDILQLSFQQVRPLHTALVVWWIFLIFTGGVYYYLSKLSADSTLGLNRDWTESKSAQRLALGHFVLFFVGGLLILSALAAGMFGGREYLEYPPKFSLLLFAGWILFAINVFKTCGLFSRKWPVFIWMWFTGTGLFLLSFVEAHLWLLPYFGLNIVRDITVQWKSYGSLVATWNMFVYGTALCVMYLISGDRQALYGKKPYALYFLGLINALFNWGHHTYILPAADWLRTVAYLVSMTELLLLGNIIWCWRRDHQSDKSVKKSRSCWLFTAADVWILLNLILALVLSVPALNVFLHGTHAIVAHSMGTTVGINTMILLASLYFIAGDSGAESEQETSSVFRISLAAVNGTLLVFWLALIYAGIQKGYLRYAQPELPYREIMLAIRPSLVLFVAFGIAMAGCFLPIVLPLLLRFTKGYRP